MRHFTIPDGISAVHCQAKRPAKLCSARRREKGRGIKSRSAAVRGFGDTGEALSREDDLVSDAFDNLDYSADEDDKHDEVNHCIEDFVDGVSGEYDQGGDDGDDPRTETVGCWH